MILFTKSIIRSIFSGEKLLYNNSSKAQKELIGV